MFPDEPHAGLVDLGAGGPDAARLQLVVAGEEGEALQHVRPGAKELAVQLRH